MGDEYRSLCEDEIPRLASVLTWAFAMQAADVEPWVRLGGIENVRVVARGDSIAACLLAIPMGQFFGGRRVETWGIAGVGSAPEARGTGAAVTLMREALREMHAKGVALSTLYPATRALYRKVGYETAGARYEVSVPLASIKLADRAPPLRTMTAEDEEAVTHAYRSAAARVNGHLDRGRYIWHRLRNPRNQHARGFVVGEGRDVEGYALLYEKRDPSLRYALVATDLVATTGRAARRLLSFAADHGTLGTTLVYHGSPDDPFVFALPTVDYAIKVDLQWMLRIAHVAASLRERGYPAGVEAELHLDVRDDLLPENSGRVVARIAGGRAEVTAGGEGRLKLDVRALAALYSGHIDAPSLAAMHLLEGPDADVAAAAEVFASRAPWMRDFF